MLAETVYPIAQTLSDSEKEKLIRLLQSDVQKPATLKLVTDKDIERNKRIAWLKKYVLPYAPKRSIF